MSNFLFIKIDSEFLKVSFSDILYIEAVNKYVRIVTKKKVYLISVTMHFIENVLPPDLFCRIHRYYIVSLEHMDKFDNDIVFIENKKFPIGKQYKGSLPSKVTTLQSDNKINHKTCTIEIDALLNKINS